MLFKCNAVRQRARIDREYRWPLTVAGQTP
jgi:hypothetical protein